MREKKFNIDGFQSIYPEEWVKWRYIIKVVENTVETFNFKEISPPSIEKRELYEIKPPWSEGLISQTFSFFDKNKKNLTLIPEQTPTRARMVQEFKAITLPIRWFNTSKRWRQEDLGKRDRAKEFWQTDIDIIGCNSVESDAEILMCAASIYKNLGLGEEVKIFISNRKLLENILSYVGIKNFYNAVKIVDDKEKISSKEFFRRFRDLGLNKNQITFLDNATSISGSFDEGISRIEKINKQIAKKSIDILKRLNKLSELLKWYGVYNMCRIDLSIARGSFYTGIIFEVSDNNQKKNQNKKLGALSGGGRYDWLISKYGKRDLPAIGFGFGYLGTIEKLKDSGIFYSPRKKKSIFVSCEYPQKNYQAMIKLVNILRSVGHFAEIDTGIRHKININEDYGCSIVFKRDFYKNCQAEVTIKNKKNKVKIDNCFSFSKNLKY